MVKALAYHAHTLSMVKKYLCSSKLCFASFYIIYFTPHELYWSMLSDKGGNILLAIRCFYYTHLCDYSHVTFFCGIGRVSWVFFLVLVKH